MRNQKFIVPALTLLLGVATSAIVQARAEPAAIPSEIVTTTHGAVRGLVGDKGISAFKGIRYVKIFH